MGYVYKFTHTETGKWYIGSHNGKKPKYAGGGLLFGKAKKKYGLASFVKEILYTGDDFRNEEERILKLLDAATDHMSYNMKNEALGGTFFGEDNGMYGKKHSDESRYKCGSAFRGKKRPDHSEKMKGENNPRFGKSEHAHGIVAYSKSCTGKTLEDIHGIENALNIKKKISDSLCNSKHNENWKIRVCPYCLLSGKGPNMSRYHFDNCKEFKMTDDKNKRSDYNIRIEELRLLGYKRPKQSESIKGPNNGMFGKSHSLKTRKQMSDNMKGRVPHNKSNARCPICDMQASPSIIKKYHGLGKTNCKK